MRSFGLVLASLVVGCAAEGPQSGDPVLPGSGVFEPEAPGEAPLVSVAAEPAPTVSAALPLRVSTHVLATREPAAAPVLGVPHDFAFSRMGIHRPGFRLDDTTIFEHPRLRDLPPAQLALRAEAPPAAPAADSVDWNVLFNASTNVSPAIYTLSYTAGNNANDRLYAYGTDATNGMYIGGFGTLYDANATLLTMVKVDSPVDGSALTIDTVRRVYAVTGGSATVPAAVWLINAGGTTYTKYTLPSGRRVKWSSPWYDNRTGRLFVGDEQGDIVDVDVSTGTGTARQIYSPGVAIHSTPVVYNDLIWFGDDAGHLCIYDLHGPTGFDRRGCYTLCSTFVNNQPVCSRQDAQWSSIYIDGTNDRVFVTENNYIWRVSQASQMKTCTVGENGDCPRAYGAGVTGLNDDQAITWSSPIVDLNSNSSLYWGRNHTLVRCQYNVNGSDTQGNTRVLSNCGTGGATQSNAGDNTYPRATPTQYPGYTQIFIGDGGGYMNRFSNGANPTHQDDFQMSVSAGTNRTTRTTAIDGTAIIDFTDSGTGHLYYGATTTTTNNNGGGGGNPVTGGALIQLIQGANW